MDITMDGIVGEVQFDADEGAVQRTYYVECSKNTFREMILTNKNLWFTYENKKKGLFAKQEKGYIKKPLNTIKVIDGITKVDVISYFDDGHVLSIMFDDDKVELRFDDDYDTGEIAESWRNAIDILLVGVDVCFGPNRKKIIKIGENQEEYDEEEFSDDNEVNESSSVIPLSYSDNQNSQQGYTSFNVANGEKICDVILKSVGPNKVKEIEVIKRSLNIGLKEAKEIVDSAPTCVLENVPLSVGQRLAEQMSNEGADVHIVIKNIQD